MRGTVLILGGIMLAVPRAHGERVPAPETGDFATLATTLFTVNGETFFPLGIYHFPKGIDEGTKYDQLAAAGFNMVLLPLNVSKEELDSAHAHGIRVMITPRGQLQFRGDIDLDKRKAQLLENLGPGSMIYEHPAVIALEMPDEPLWAEKGRMRADGTPQELFTWARTPAEQERIHESIRELKDAYAWLRETCGDRYGVWLNFAPRSSEAEMRWFSELPSPGGYPPDPRTAADAFGTDVYPVPDGGGNNGWVNGRIVRSPAAVGVFTDRLLRAVYPHPAYMVLHGCGILDWQKAQNPDGPQRRPTLEENRFMTFQSIVHGARGILYWGVHYIEPDSLMWSDLRQVAREVNAFTPILLEGEPWAQALVGTSRLESLALTHEGDHYLLVVNPGDWPEARIAAPGWKGTHAFSLLDGRTVVVEDGVLSDQIPSFGTRIYTDSDILFSRFGRSRVADALAAGATAPVLGISGVPASMDPFAGKTPGGQAGVFESAGANAVFDVPADRALVDALHARGIRAYGKVDFSAGPEDWKEHPEIQPVSANGEPLSATDAGEGICLCQDAFSEAKLAAVDALTRDSGLDGVWLDGVRWPGRWEGQNPPIVRACFCPECLRQFERDRAVHIPREFESTARKAAWIREHAVEDWNAWRADRVVDVVRRARIIVKKNLGPDALVGLLTVPLRGEDYDGAAVTVFGQDPAKLRQFVDVFSPLAFHAACERPPEWIPLVVKETAEVSEKPVWPAVRTSAEGSDLPPREFEESIEAALQPPAGGVIVRTTGSVLREGKWPILSRAFRERSGP